MNTRHARHSPSPQGGRRKRMARNKEVSSLNHSQDGRERRKERLVPADRKARTITRMCRKQGGGMYKRAEIMEEES